jgi:hypothetical protein
MICCLPVLLSCKKDSKNPPLPEGNPNNEVNAIVSFLAGKDSVHKANGNRTLFARSVHTNGDSIIVIRGSIGEYGTFGSRHISISLVNVSAVGTYSLRVEPGSKTKAWCDYEVGDVFVSQVYQVYSSMNTDQPGTVTIEALTPTSIQGSFSANCANRVQIKNGTFKGSFL